MILLLSINLNPGNSHHLTWVFSFHQFSSIKFSHSVMSDSLQPHGLQHIRLPYPSPTHRVYSISCPSSWWCHPTISSSIVLLLPPSIFPSNMVFTISQFFPSGGQSIGVSASASILSMNIQGWFPLGWIVGSPCSPRDSQESSPTPQKICFFPYLELNHQFGSLQILTICIKRKLG